ncbi:hypothetical protein Tco_0757391 [Tanacetum coccineum]
MSKIFYYSIFGDKDEGKSHVRTLIDIPVFVGSFSIISGFTIIDDDDMTKDIVLDMKFCKKYASYQRIMKRFALGNNCERIVWIKQKPQENGQTRTQERKSTQRAERMLWSKLQSTWSTKVKATKGQNPKVIIQSLTKSKITKVVPNP